MTQQGVNNSLFRCLIISCLIFFLIIEESLFSFYFPYDLRDVIFVVYNFHSVQKPAGTGLAVVMSDPEFLQDPQVDCCDVENVLLGHTHANKQATDSRSRKV